MRGRPLLPARTAGRQPVTAPGHGLPRGCRSALPAPGAARGRLEAFLVALQDAGRSPATISNRWRALRHRFKYLGGEGESARSPMRRMTPPRVPDQSVPMFSSDELGPRVATCRGPGFEHQRDEAILGLLADTGTRCAERLALPVEDLDVGQDVAVVIGHGPSSAGMPFGPQTGLVLGRYLRARRRCSAPRATRLARWLLARDAASASTNGHARPIAGSARLPALTPASQRRTGALAARPGADFNASRVSRRCAAYPVRGGST